MTVTAQELQEMYELFNNNDSTAIVNQFAPGAVYKQLDTGQVAVGHEQIAIAMANWKTFFLNAQIGDFRIQPADELVEAQVGAVQCYVVNFVGVGRYDQTISGLEQVAPANHRDVRLPISETVWLNGAGQLVRVDNAISITALQ